MADTFGSGNLSQGSERKADGGWVPDIRADQGGSCMARYNGMVLPSNRTEHILSRYRPIAPKPLAIKPGESAGSAPSDPQSSSTLSFERTSAKATSASSDGSRGKRSRKRLGTDYLLSPRRPAKRGSARPTVRPDKPRTVSCRSTVVIGGIEKSVEQFAEDKSGLQQQRPPMPAVGGFVPLKEGPPPTYVTEMAPTDTRAVFTLPGPGRADRRKYSYGFGAMGMEQLAQQAVFDSRVGSSGSDTCPRVASMSDTCPPNCDCSEKRGSALMARAGTSTSMNGFQKIRGYGDSLPQSQRGGPDGEATLRHSDVFLHGQKCGPGGQTYPLAGVGQMDRSFVSCLRGGSQHQLPAHQSFSNSIGESEVISDADSRKTNLVTLSLLPDKPSHEYNRSVASRPSCKNVPFLPLAMGIDMRSWESDTNQESSEELHKLTLFSNDFGSESKEEEPKSNSLSESERQRSWGTSSSSEKQSHAIEGHPLLRALDKSSGSAASCRGGNDRGETVRAGVIESGDMEQAYSASSDPVMLTEEGNGCSILWANYAFKRAATEKSSGKDKEIGGPYLDPLGIATQLSSFSYQTPQGPVVKAVLWGFLKKFMMPETKSPSLLTEGREKGEDTNQTPPQRKLSVNLDENFSASFQSSHPKPITPQPLRPVGSTLTVECVDSVNRYASPITDNLESVKEQLESAAMPSVITDYRNRVRWVNAAYKQMVGQPECSWLASTVGKKTTREQVQHSRLTGEVVLTCNEPLSQLAAIFSCRVHVQWTNQGEVKSITVPSEVTRIDNERLGNMYVWKLDTLSTDSRLQNGASRYQDAGQFKQV